jgi:hypothetical protein
MSIIMVFFQELFYLQPIYFVLDKHFGYNFEENIKYGGGVQQQRKEEKEIVESVVKEHSGLKCTVKAYLVENKER